VKEFAVYTALRLALLVAAFAVIGGVWYLAFGSTDGLLLIPLVLAFVVSAVASAYLLKAQRDALTRRIEARASAASRSFEAMRAKEDDD
jgi:uncharacterized membrane protein (DUF4010 family)